LVDARGLTLYRSKNDVVGRAPKCVGRCLDQWTPLAAPWAARGTGDWSVVTRADGAAQWAFRGKPLYRHPKGDVVGGEVTGHGVDDFEAIVLEPAPTLPPWATIQASDAGELIADQRGLTVYARWRERTPVSVLIEAPSLVRTELASIRNGSRSSQQVVRRRSVVGGSRSSPTVVSNGPTKVKSYTPILWIVSRANSKGFASAAISTLVGDHAERRTDAGRVGRRLIRFRTCAACPSCR
jgi:hypothetical protein